ncbi:MAG: hypothetical protein ACLGJB_17720 [Blastocatellia bacterium]
MDIPRNEGESASHYLYRLVLALAEREEIELKAGAKSASELVKKISGLTTGLAESFKMPSIPVVLPPPNPQYKTNQILEDVRENLHHQRRFNEATANSIELTASALDRIEKRVEGWEKKFDEGSKQSGRQGKINIWIQIFLGLIALVALYYGYKAYELAVRNQNAPTVTAPATPENPPGEVK